MMAQSDASYLSESDGRSRAGEYIYLRDGPNDIAMNEHQQQKQNMLHFLSLAKPKQASDIRCTIKDIRKTSLRLSVTINVPKV